MQQIDVRLNVTIILTYCIQSTLIMKFLFYPNNDCRGQFEDNFFQFFLYGEKNETFLLRSLQDKKKFSKTTAGF